MSGSRRTSWILLILLGLFFAGYVLYPLLVLARQSLQGDGGFSFQRYASLLDPSNRGNMEAAINSVVVSILSVLLGGAVGLLLAFCTTQLRFPFRPLIANLAVLPVALPPLVGVIAFLLVFGESGILPRLVQAVTGVAAQRVALDGIPAIVAVHVYSFNVYFFVFVAAALRKLDSAQVEAATGLGAGSWKVFRSVVLPELRPALLGASILTFLSSMASFSAPLLFAGGRRFITLQIFTTKMNGDMPLASAQSLLLAAVSIGFFVLLQRSAGSSVTLRRTKGSARPGMLPVGRIVKVLLIVLSAVIVLLEALPLIVILLVSFAREGSWTYQLLPASYTVDNYVRLFSEPQVLQPIENSILMAVIALAGTILVGVAGAYLVSKGALRKVRFLADVVLTVPYAIPGTVLAISLILAYNRGTIFTGSMVLVGTFWILPLAYLLRTYPLMMRSVSASLAQVDDGVLEAAESFGAGEWAKFRRVVLPLILPGIIGGAVLTLITLLGEFVASILLYTYASRPIAVEILAQVRAYDLGTAAAYCVVLLVLIMGIVGGVGIYQRKGPGTGG